MRCIDCTQWPASKPLGEHLTDEHWYRTSDRVTRSDGHLVHVSRLDHQV